MNKFQAKMDASFKAMEAIRKAAEAENRSLTDDELAKRASLKAEIDQTKKEWDDFKSEEELRVSLYGTSDGALTIPDGATISAPDAPIYRSAFPFGEQVVDIVRSTHPGSTPQIRQAAVSRLEQVANREEQRAAGTGGHVEAIGPDGGWLLQSETSIDLMGKGFANSEILKRCAKRTLTTANKIEIITVKETSRVDGSRGGGVRVYTTAELDAMTQSKTQFEKITIEPFKLTGLYYASDEILADAGFLQQEMSGLFQEEFAFKTQDLAIRGTGAGQALGVKNASCLVSVAKETAQKADTILSENLVKMKSRVFQRNRANLVWIINQDVEPQLYFLTIAIGTGGATFPAYIPPGASGNSNLYGTLLGIPCIPVEQCDTLGDKGDIMLCDFSQYYVADKGAMNSASSIHLKFDYNQTTFRFIYRIDGRPRWTSAVTPYKGSATISPFVTLDERA